MKYIFKPEISYNWRRPENWLRIIKYDIIDYTKCLWQRAFRGYSHRNIWSIDYYLTKIIPLMIKQLKEDTHGYPGGEDINSLEEWQKILDKMILGFEAAKRIQETKNWVENDNNEMYTIPSKDGGREIKFTNPWSDEQVKEFKRLDDLDFETFNEGMELFGKYFFNLWN